jgi:hypothetical protein
MLGKPLQDGTNAHDHRTRHDRHSSSVLLIEPRGDGDSEDRTELVARGDEAKKAIPDSRLPFGIDVSITEVCFVSKSVCGRPEGILTLVEGCRELKRVDELRVETRGHLNTHAAQEQVHVHNPKVRLLEPWYLVLRDKAGDNGVRGFSCLDHLVEGVGERKRRASLQACRTSEASSYSLPARPHSPASSPDQTTVGS